MILLLKRRPTRSRQQHLNDQFPACCSSTTPRDPSTSTHGMLQVGPGRPLSRSGGAVATHPITSTRSDARGESGSSRALPAVSTWPSTTSDTSSGPSPARRSASRMTAAPSSCAGSAALRVVRVGAQTGLEGLRRRAPHAAGIVPIAPCSIAAHPQKESAPVGLIPVF